MAHRSPMLDRRAVLRMLQPVDSSNLESIGYDADTRTLYVRFLSTGRVYAYFDVERDVFEELQQADSKGGYFNSLIRGAFPYEQLY